MSEHQRRDQIGEISPGGKEKLELAKQRDKKTGRGLMSLLQGFSFGRRRRERAGAPASAEVTQPMPALTEARGAAPRLSQERDVDFNPSLDQEGGKHAASIERNPGDYKPRHAKLEADELPPAVIDADWVEGRQALADQAQPNEYNPNHDPQVIGTEAWFSERENATGTPQVHSPSGDTEITHEAEQPVATTHKVGSDEWYKARQSEFLELAAQHSNADHASPAPTAVESSQPLEPRAGRHRRAA